MNKYQRVLNQLVKNDIDIPEWMTFRGARNVFRGNLRYLNADIGFLRYMRNEQIKEREK